MHYSDHVFISKVDHALAPRAPRLPARFGRGTVIIDEFAQLAATNLAEYT
jgi:hypothetical protein